MDEVARYLGAVFRHGWKALGSGTLGLVLTFSSDVTLGHRSALIVIIGGSAVMLAAFLGWRDEHRENVALSEKCEAVVEKQPHGILSIVSEGEQIYVAVRNDGALGMFTMTIEVRNATESLLRPVSAAWDHLDDGSEVCPIPKGVSRRARVAYIEVDEQMDPNNGTTTPTYRWPVVFHRHGKGEKWFGGGYELVEKTDKEWWDVIVVVTSEPAMLEGAVVRRIRFVGRTAIDLISGQRHELEPYSVHRDYDPDEYLG